MASAPVILYLVTEDWYFLSHRLPMARAAQRAGYEVHVATHVVDGGPEIEKLGFTLHPLDWRRGSMNPAHVLALVRDIRALYRRVAPALVHHVALQPAVVGSLAAAGVGVHRLNALAGLGSGFTSPTLTARLFRPVLRGLVRWMLAGERAWTLVQNPDDRAAVRGLGVPDGKIFLIPGSGVDTELLTPMPEPELPVTVGFVGRLLDDKGVRVLVQAHDILAKRGEPVRLMLAGTPDPANPTSIPADEIAGWAKRPGIAVLGHVADIREVWANAHIAALPSRREGLPKSLLEAASCGRPIVATDVPGCREIARHGLNALLVPPDDPAMLAEAIARLARDPDLRRAFGAAGRRLVEGRFSERQVGEEIVALYGRLLAGAGPLSAVAASPNSL